MAVGSGKARIPPTATTLPVARPAPEQFVWTSVSMSRKSFLLLYLDGTGTEFTVSVAGKAGRAVTLRSFAATDVFFPTAEATTASPELPALKPVWASAEVARSAQTNTPADTIMPFMTLPFVVWIRRLAASMIILV